MTALDVRCTPGSSGKADIVGCQRCARRRHSELRVPPSRPIVGIDEFAVGPLRTLMSISKRFLEIAHLLAVLHYNRTVDHITGNHPVLAIPLQNPFQLPRPLRFHAKLVPELADRWTDRCERADEHRREHILQTLECSLWIDFRWYWHHLLKASKH